MTNLHVMMVSVYMIPGCVMANLTAQISVMNNRTVNVSTQKSDSDFGSDSDFNLDSNSEVD